MEKSRVQGKDEDDARARKVKAEEKVLVAVHCSPTLALLHLHRLTKYCKLP
jgi:hypothetical protein